MAGKNPTASSKVQTGAKPSTGKASTSARAQTTTDSKGIKTAGSGIPKPPTNAAVTPKASTPKAPTPKAPTGGKVPKK